MCICSSLLGAFTSGAEPPPPTASELELGLARMSQLYLVVDLQTGILEVKARGMRLDVIALKGTGVAALQPMMGSQSWPALPLPQLWRVSRQPAGGWRRLIAPSELRRYSEAAAVPAPSTDTTREIVDLPADYSFEVDAGWQVVITRKPNAGLWRRMWHAAVDSRRRWSGGDTGPSPPRLMLVMAPEDARHLLHMILIGLPILLTAPGASSPAPGGLP